MKKINVITLCSGYDAMAIALKRLRDTFPEQLDFDLLAWSEIDFHACQAHDAIHPEYADRNLGDMTQIDWEAWKQSQGNPFIDLLIYSTPCQSVSTAGKQKGMKKGDDEAASALIWHTEKAIDVLRPKYLLLENVKGMVSKRNKADFDEWCGILESYGYTNFWQVLNASQFGVPQNRERVFMVSVLRTESDPNPQYNFPAPFPLEKRLKDVLETNVSEEYYLRDEQVQRIIEHCDRKVAEGCGFKMQKVNP